MHFPGIEDEQLLFPRLTDDVTLVFSSCFFRLFRSSTQSRTSVA